jgi:sulfonate transport system substrate-binding protein
MKSKNYKFIGLKLKSIFSFSLLLVFAITFYSCNRTSNKSTKEQTRLIVGWQTAWATCGQIIETLDHTNITKLYNSNATYRNFLFGPDMLEAALGGNIDATTTGIVPSVNLMAASDDWVGVCRLIDFSCVTIARNGTNIKSYKDLLGKKLGVPFGSGAHPYVVQRLEENNLPIGKGKDKVELVNISPAEAIVVLKQGGVDAIGIWEPNATIIESKNIGTVFDEKAYIGLLTVRKSLVDNHPEEVIALIKCIIEANLYVAKNRGQTDNWFAERSNFDKEILKKIRIIEPNLNAKSIGDISVDLTPEDIVECQKVADKMFENDLIKKKINLNERLNSELAKIAKKQLIESGSKQNSIE